MICIQIEMGHRRFSVFVPELGQKILFFSNGDESQHGFKGI